MRDQIAQADKLASIGELSAGIAHEINNPLGVILGFAQLILRNETQNEPLREDIKTIEKHTRHCKSIVEDLLNFARTSKPEKTLCDVHAIIDDVMHFIQQHAKMGNVRFEKSYDHRIQKLLLDEKKIKQVFINLVMNAKHAIGDKGTIQVTSAKDDNRGRVLIKVIDDGRGIEKKNVSAFSIRFSPPNRPVREQGWGCPSVTASSKIMAAISSWKVPPAEAPRLRWNCPFPFTRQGVNHETHHSHCRR